MIAIVSEQDWLVIFIFLKLTQIVLLLFDN